MDKSVDKPEEEGKEHDYGEAMLSPMLSQMLSLLHQRKRE